MIKKNQKNSALETFLKQLRAFHKSCGKPSYRTLADISGRLHKLYGDRDLPRLSATAVSEVLGGRRKGFPSSAWLASFILSCQRRAWETGHIPEDPGATVLPTWQETLRKARASADAAGRRGNSHRRPSSDPPSGGAPPRDGATPPGRHHRGTTDRGTPAEGPGTSTPPPNASPPEPRRSDRDPGGGHGGSAMVMWLPASPHDYVAGYGPHGQTLLTKMRSGNPDAAYRVAVLLGADPAQSDEALALLIHAAAAGHVRALDLLEVSDERLDRLDAAAHACGLADAAAHACGLADAAAHACGLADATAHACGLTDATAHACEPADTMAQEESLAAALAYYECAARCGLPSAAVKLAEVLLDSGDVQQATIWLTIAAEQEHTVAEIHLAELHRGHRFPPPVGGVLNPYN